MRVSKFKSWDTGELIRIAPTLIELVSIEMRTNGLAGLGISIFSKAAEIISISLNVDAAEIKGWDLSKTAAILDAIFKVNGKYFRGLSEENSEIAKA